jgi:hypothetical protein
VVDEQAMAPSRGTLFTLAALLLSSLVVITLTYGTSRFGQNPDFRIPITGSQDQHASVSEDLAIPLHPAEHALREPEVLSLRWKITKGYRSPDGVKKLVYLINGTHIGRCSNVSALMSCR